MIKVKAKKGNLLKIKNATEEEENIIRELGHFFNGKDKSLIKIGNGNKLKIKDLKHFILESENRLLDLSTNQIYPTIEIIKKYSDTFGKYGEMRELYEQNRLPNLRRVYYPYIKEVRKIKKNYLSELKEIKINKDDSMIESSKNIDDVYLPFINFLLSSGTLDYHINKKTILNDSKKYYEDEKYIYFYEYSVENIMLSIANRLDIYDEIYGKDKKIEKTQWNLWSTTTLGDAARFFPKIMDTIYSPSIDESEYLLDLNNEYKTKVREQIVKRAFSSINYKDKSITLKKGEPSVNFHNNVSVLIDKKEKNILNYENLSIEERDEILEVLIQKDFNVRNFEKHIDDLYFMSADNFIKLKEAC